MVVRLETLDFAPPSLVSGYRVSVEPGEVFFWGDLVTGAERIFLNRIEGFGDPPDVTYSDFTGAVIIPLDPFFLKEDSVTTAQLNFFQGFGAIVALHDGSPQFSAEIADASPVDDIDAAWPILPTLSSLQFQITEEEIATHGNDGKLTIAPLLTEYFAGKSVDSSLPAAYQTHLFIRDEIGLNVFWTSDTQLVVENGESYFKFITEIESHFVVEVESELPIVNISGIDETVRIREGDAGPEVSISINEAAEEDIYISFSIRGNLGDEDLTMRDVILPAGSTSITHTFVSVEKDVVYLEQIESGFVDVEAWIDLSGLPDLDLELNGEEGKTVSFNLEVEDYYFENDQDGYLIQSYNAVEKVTGYSATLMEALLLVGGEVKKSAFDAFNKALDRLGLVVDVGQAWFKYKERMAEAAKEDAPFRYRLELAAKKELVAEGLVIGLEAVATKYGAAGLAAVLTATKVTVGLTASAAAAPVLAAVIAGFATQVLWESYEDQVRAYISENILSENSENYYYGKRALEDRVFGDTPVGGAALEFKNGTKGNDDVLGTSGNDGALLDKGDDRFEGKGGRDAVFGEAGRDKIFGQSAKDLLFGGSGQDRLFGGTGSDELNGDGGNDKISGGSGNDRMTGGNGKDVLKGQGGEDLLLGGGGNDLLIGGKGNDSLDGQGGNDSIFGGNGADLLKGGSGSDILKGQGGNDKLFGGKGRDLLDGGTGVNKLTGNGGADFFVFKAGKTTITDYQKLDKIDLKGSAGRADLEGIAIVKNGNLVLEFSSKDQLTINNIEDLSELNFI